MKCKQNSRNKGITLIALVITIIVLLILAGVSIATLTGDNGILGQAQKAKIETEKAGRKEKLQTAIASWQIEHTTGSEITLKEYLEDSNKSGLENIQVIKENSDDLTVGRYEDKMWILKDNAITVMNSDNLVNNGFLEQNDNNIFAECSYNEAGYISFNAQGEKIIFSTDFIEVDTSKKYLQSLTAKGNNAEALNYIGITEYDIDKKTISADSVKFIKDSLTYLEKDLNNGDTEIYLNDVSGFKVDSDTPHYQRGFIFWNYKDSTGYQYPEYTYSRNVFKDMFSSTENIDLINNKITLNKPWSAGKYEKGTKLSQSNDGATHNYGLLANKKLNNYWTTYTNYIQGKNNPGETKSTEFRQGTKYIKILLIANLEQSIESTIDMKDIIFAECE